MAGRGAGPDFVEALARGLDILACFDAARPSMNLSEIAAASGLARPTARRLLLTLVELGYVRIEGNTFALTPQVLRLGMAYMGALGLWDIARPHLEALVAQTGESSTMSELDGPDIVYVARVSVRKIIAIRGDVGSRFPAIRTSQGKVLLAALSEEEQSKALATPSRSGLPPFPARELLEVRDELRSVRERGWALADEELAPGVRSVAVPVYERGGGVRVAMNVTVHASETSLDTLLGEHLPKLLATAGRISADWVLWQSRPQTEMPARRVRVRPPNPSSD